MKNILKNTPNLFRVFFAVFLVSFVGTFIAYSNDAFSEIKIHGGTFTEGIIGSPRFINPVLAQSQVDYDVTRLLFTPMLSVNNLGEVTYELIENIDLSDDKLVYTITIKDNLLFSDGNTLTTDDVIFTIETIQDPLIKSPLYNRWQGVSAEKINNKKFSITLNQPFYDFLYNLEIGVLPKHIWSNIKPEEFIFSIYNSEPINIGPYKVKDISKKENGVPDAYRFVPNKKFDSEPYIEKLILRFFENEEGQIKALKSGEIDAIYGISPKKLYEINTSKYTIISDRLPRVFAVFFNEKKQGLLTAKIRESINIIINKEVIVNDVFSGYAKTIDLPTGGKKSEEKEPLEKAHEIIIAEGWKKDASGFYTRRFLNKDQRLSFSISVPDLVETLSVAEHIQLQLKEQGIDVIIKPYEQGDLNQNVIRSREYESLLFGYELEKPSDLFAFWHSSQISDPGLNVALFQDPRTDIELTNLREQGVGNIGSITKSILQRNSALFLYSPSYVYILPKNLSVDMTPITQGSDRFNSISKWYMRTAHVWSIFVDNEK
jgi:peptide/nickel transport system substrate-binding protein